MPGWDDDWWVFAASGPRAAKGGIKARSKRGAFASTWWGQRWLAVLESLDLGGRLSRGRSYARGGQVVGLEIKGSRILAKVQGSRPRPYEVAIEISRIPRSEWQTLARALGKNLRIAASLMAGEMPPELEHAFGAAGVTLFPGRAEELVTSCSCPDWSNPCKHVAAVYYLLAEELDRDPFLLLRLRGVEREEFVRLLGAAPAPRQRRTLDRARPKSEAEESEVLPADPAMFWQGTRVSGDVVGSASPPASPGPLAKRLGSFPFWRGEEDFFDALSRSYVAASERGMRAYFGAAGDNEADWR